MFNSAIPLAQILLISSIKMDRVSQPVLLHYGVESNLHSVFARTLAQPDNTSTRMEPASRIVQLLYSAEASQVLIIVFFRAQRPLYIGTSTLHALLSAVLLTLWSNTAECKCAFLPVKMN